jgi:hypothetical protein
MKFQRAALALAMSGAGTLGATFIVAAPANAVQPVVQACVGTTHSSNNAAYDGPTGQITSAFARSRVDTAPGLGDGIHDLQLGLIPDSLVPNTCNG